MCATMPCISFFVLFLKVDLLLVMHLGVSRCVVCMCGVISGVCGDLGVIGSVSCRTCVLGTELKSAARAARALNCPSPQPHPRVLNHVLPTVEEDCTAAVRATGLEVQLRGRALA